MSSRSSKKIRDAEKLKNDYQSYFGGKYSADKTGSGSLWTTAMLSKCRLLILFGVCFVASIFTLYKTKPKWILQQRRSFDEPDKISAYRLIKYSFSIGFLLFVSLAFLAYRFPKLKEILYTTENCDLCRS